LSFAGQRAWQLAVQGDAAAAAFGVTGKSRSSVKRRKAKRQQAAQTTQSAGVTNPIELVRKVKELAASAGGLSKLKQLVDLLAE
jgi:hypothetical protein